MTAPRAWADYSKCNACGASSGTRCYDENDTPKARPCKLRKLRMHSKMPLSVNLSELRVLLADRTEQVRNLQAKLERAEKLLAEIHALSK